MNITQTITLDLSQVGVFTAVNAKQGDDKTRFVRAVILDGGMVWQVPEGATAGFRCVKPDGHSCQNPAVINDDGTVTVELTAQVLAVPGTVWADICFVNASGQVLSTASFAIYVAGVPQGQGVPSSNEFLTLVDMVERGEAVLAELTDAETGFGAQVSGLKTQLETHKTENQAAFARISEQVDTLMRGHEDQDNALTQLHERLGAVESGSGSGGGSGGADGATFVPSVSEEGVLSWTNNAGLPNPEPVNIRGPQGEKGEKGDKGDPGEGGGSGEGGVSSWNDLEDKPFSEELGMVALFDEQEVTGFQIHSVYQLPFKAFTPSPFLLIPGETYQVKWKGLTWTCTAIDGDDVIPGAAGIGNGYLFGQPDTGEPFAIFTFATTNELGICPLDGSASVTVGIFREGMVVTPLDAKYLPMDAIDARIEEIINAALEGDY